MRRTVSKSCAAASCGTVSTTAALPTKAENKDSMSAKPWGRARDRGRARLHTPTLPGLRNAPGLQDPRVRSKRTSASAGGQAVGPGPEEKEEGDDDDEKKRQGGDEGGGVGNRKKWGGGEAVTGSAAKPHGLLLHQRMLEA
eukprot:242922-Pyramimonas_sp.AAC.1